MRLAGKIAMVTGAGQGIGRGCALQLAREGADLVINDRPGSKQLAEVANEVRNLGRTCRAIEADVFSRAGCEELVQRSLGQVAEIDILISNPALNSRSSFLEQDPLKFEQQIQATLVAGFHISQLIARHMVARGRGGKIVFISSVQAELPMANSIAYGPAKAALNHLARSIAVELAPHRINVNAIEPGWIDTPGERLSFSEETIEREAANLPLGRLGTPEEIGKAAAFLCSNDADYVTGTILVVDGAFRYKEFVPRVIPHANEDQP